MWTNFKEYLTIFHRVNVTCMQKVWTTSAMEGSEC